MATSKALINWQDTRTYRFTPRQDMFNTDAVFIAAKSLVTRTGDTVTCGSFVAVRVEAVHIHSSHGSIDRSNIILVFVLCTGLRDNQAEGLHRGWQT